LRCGVAWHSTRAGHSIVPVQLRCGLVGQQTETGYNLRRHECPTVGHRLPQLWRDHRAIGESSMAVKTQGTDLYVIDPQDGSVISVACVTNISGLDSQLDQIETTCLSETARTYMAGLAAPGTATFGVRF